ncbi:MAG: thioredoxin family protein [Bacteroidota bacterium]
MNPRVQSTFEKGMSYASYMQFIGQLVEEKRTTGPKQTEKMAEYTRLNYHRMKRLEKTMKLIPEARIYFQSITYPMNWLVITEAWCGDAAQLIPIFQKIAELNPQIDLRFTWRDENPELMDLYLTHGSRSIPKLVAFEPGQATERAIWGPRPKEAHDLVLAYKENPSKPYEELQQKLQIWYNKDKGIRSQQELIEAFGGK